MDVQERQYLTPELQEQSIAPKLQTHMVYQMDQTNDSNESGDDTGYTGHEIRYELIGKWVREYRKKQRLTQQALAEKVGLVPSNISHIERGTTKLSIQSLIRIANALHVSAESLLCDNLEHTIQPFQQEIADIIDDCSPREIRILAEILVASKEIIRNHIS